MELIKLEKTLFINKEIKISNLSNGNLECFYVSDFFYPSYDKDEYLKKLSPILIGIQNKKKYIISEFYFRSDKHKLCLFKNKSDRIYFNEAIYNDKLDISSLLSFIRFYDFLPNVNVKYSWRVKGNIIILDIKNINNVLLQLRFLENGNIDFLSLDEDPIAKDDYKTYVLKGTFSTSEYLDKSYKIKRLLNILYE